MDVIEGRVMFTDRVKGTNFIISAPGHCMKPGQKNYLKKQLLL